MRTSTLQDPRFAIGPAEHRSGFVAAITTGPWHNLYGSADVCAASPRVDGRFALPLHARTELLICGITLFACDLALRSARAGKMTTLVMDRANWTRHPADRLP